MTYIISKDSLKLQRENASFFIGFGSIKGKLSDLSPQQKLLHVDEISRFNNFKFEMRKHSYLLGRVSAKQAIESIRKNHNLSEILIGEGIFNFPVIKHLTGDHLQLSISHCDDIGISLAYPEEHPMGIDIEKLSEKSVDALGSMTNQSESNIIDKLPITKIEGMGVIWTVKEALSKILRTGMMMDFSSFEVSKITYNGQYFLSEYKHLGQYKAISFINAPYITSLALPGRSEIDTDQVAGLINQVLINE